jgi:hypothetical protein
LDGKIIHHRDTEAQRTPRTDHVGTAVLGCPIERSSTTE